MEKIGVGIITHNREDFFKKVQDSIPDYVNLYVVNTGSPYPKSMYDKRATVHQCDKKTCVGWGKNQALRMMREDDCVHLFTIEDDVYVIDPDVFKKYIKAAYVTGIYHFNFGFSQRENVAADGTLAIKKTVAYTDDVSIVLAANILGAFTYYHTNVIKHIGYHDERYDGNHMDHVDLSYRAIKAGLYPPYRWFADIDKSWEMIGNLSNMADDSIVRNEAEFKERFTKACRLFHYKHSYLPTTVPVLDEESVIKVLKDIHKNYAKPEKVED